MKQLFIVFITFSLTIGWSQNASIKGVVSIDGQSIPFANIYIKGTKNGTATDENGLYSITSLSPGSYTLIASAIGYEPFRKTFLIGKEETVTVLSFVSSASACSGVGMAAVRV